MILIHGRGVSALACAYRLAVAGQEVRLCGARHKGDLVVLVGEHTLDLLAEVFDSEPPRGLGHPIQGRMVQWGTTAPKWLPVPARSVRLDALTSWLESRVNGRAVIQAEALPWDGDTPRWQIDATGRGCHVARQLAGARPTTFGNRHVITVSVASRGESDFAIMEGVEEGWCFLCPTSPHRAILQLMWPNRPLQPMSNLFATLEKTRLIRNVLGPIDMESCVSLPAAPSILSTIASDRWLAVGQAAFAMDPICGDGVGAGLHSAILAVAVIQAAASGLRGEAIDHYVQRHQRSFVSHLQHVSQYYQPLLSCSAWADELESTHQFLVSPSAEHILKRLRFKYRLENSQLVPVE